MAYDSGSINSVPYDDSALTPTPGGPGKSSRYYGLNIVEEPKSCLALDGKIPVALRYGVPVLLFLNIALFITANTSIGASVYVRLTFGQDELWLPSLFDFTLANSVRDMWDAGT